MLWLYNLSITYRLSYHLHKLAIILGDIKCIDYSKKFLDDETDKIIQKVMITFNHEEMHRVMESENGIIEEFAKKKGVAESKVKELEEELKKYKEFCNKIAGLTPD